MYVYVTCVGKIDCEWRENKERASYSPICDPNNDDLILITLWLFSSVNVDCDTFLQHKIEFFFVKSRNAKFQE